MRLANISDTFTIFYTRSLNEIPTFHWMKIIVRASDFKTNSLSRAQLSFVRYSAMRTKKKKEKSSVRPLLKKKILFFSFRLSLRTKRKIVNLLPLVVKPVLPFNLKWRSLCHSKLRSIRKRSVTRNFSHHCCLYLLSLGCVYGERGLVDGIGGD